MIHPPPKKYPVAVYQVRDTFRNWRNWDVIEWFFFMFIVIFAVVIFLAVLSAIFGDHAERGTPGDVRVQRFECERSWSPATKTTTNECQWVTIEYNGAGS